MNAIEAKTLAYWSARKALFEPVSRDTVMAVFRNLTQCDFSRIRRLAFEAIKNHERAKY